jgi:polyphosphate kinase 2 (PPK2 family)
MDALQYLLFANARQSLLIVLQGLDAAGKDGVIRDLFTGMNPQGTSVASFRQPTPVESKHDFLWRAHSRAPDQGEVVPLCIPEPPPQLDYEIQRHDN